MDILDQRGRLTTLVPELQRSFLATNEAAYRELVDLLVEAGRLAVRMMERRFSPTMALNRCGWRPSPR